MSAYCITKNAEGISLQIMLLKENSGTSLVVSNRMGLQVLITGQGDRIPCLRAAKHMPHDYGAHATTKTLTARKKRKKKKKNVWHAKWKEHFHVVELVSPFHIYTQLPSTKTSGVGWHCNHYL